MNPTSQATRLLRALLLYFVLFAIFAVLAWTVPYSDNVLPPFLSVCTGACVGAMLTYLFSRGPDDNWTLWRLVAGGMALDVVCNSVAQRSAAGPQALRLSLIAFGNLGVLAAAIGIALLVARGMKKPNYLIVAAIAGAVADLVSVFAGPSKLTLDSDLFPYVSYHWGQIGRGGVGPMVGAGDFIFLAIYFSGARRFGLNERKTLLAMFAALVVGFSFSAFGDIALPAVPFMALALLLVHRSELRRLLAEWPAD
jgi:hypothetical protein